MNTLYLLEGLIWNVSALGARCNLYIDIELHLAPKQTIDYQPNYFDN